MLFFPFGVFDNEVVDPDKLAKDYQEAARVATETSQYQWRNGAFPDFTHIAADAAATVMTSQVNAILGMRGASHPSGTDRPRDPVLQTQTVGSGRTANATLFQIPYNRGWSEDDDTVQTWTSKYPELVLVAFSYQYIRDYARVSAGGYPGWPAATNDGGWEPTPISAYGGSDTPLRLRAKVRISVDGSHQPGTGPFSLPFMGNERGSGYEGTDHRTTVCAIVPLPAGTHRVSAVAAVGQHTKPSGGDHTFNDLNEKSAGQPADSPDTGICLGYRRMIVIRFPKGTTFGG
jgi:hypothetical protein